MKFSRETQAQRWTQMMFPQEKLSSVLHLYEKYRKDLRRVKNSQQEFLLKNTKVGLVPQLGDMEAEITYLQIREHRPSTVVEISPASGWSTSWILQALNDNDYGMLHSYDLVDDSLRTIHPALSKNRWMFYQGDVRANLSAMPENVDYLFVDSEHTWEFAVWYINNLFPKYKVGTRVSVHDILKWYDEPGWGPESALLCRWLSEKKTPCLTACRALKELGYTEIMNKRKELALDDSIIVDDYNSMIFFTLG